MTVLIAIDHLPAAAVHEAREACKTLGLATADWVSGTPSGAPAAAPQALIAGLDNGARQIPGELVALLDAEPQSRLVLCAQEPLVKPRVMIGDGRVCVLAPPIERAQIALALRDTGAASSTRPALPGEAALPNGSAVWSTSASPPVSPAPPITSDLPVSRRFEVLRRTHWIAWVRGRSGPDISLHETQGATIVLGKAGPDRTAIADVMAGGRSDADRESVLSTFVGGGGIAHLTASATEWLMYWPLDRFPLWLYSANRVPPRWNAARGIAAVTNRRLLRIPAYPADQLIAAWSDAPSAAGALAALEQLSAESGSDTLVELEAIVGRHDHVTSLVIEVR